MKDLLNEIIADVWDKSKDKAIKRLVVKESIPILWFGNLDSYRKSARKVITVALNPSCVEFPDKNKWERFPNCSLICDKVELKGVDLKIYKQCLNNYFKNNPYKKWFNAFDKILEAVGATFYDRTNETPNVAIHIDYFAPIATAKTWSKLEQEERNLVVEKFKGIFKRLVNELNPDVILISTNASVFKDIFGFAMDDERYLKKSFGASNSYLRGYRDQEGRAVVAGYNNRGTPFFVKKEMKFEQLAKEITKAIAL